VLEAINKFGPACNTDCLIQCLASVTNLKDRMGALELMQKNDDITRGMALHILTSRLLTRGH